jgi:hypothetical protein
MKESGLDTRRLRLVAICTVCVRPFLNEIRNMNALIEEIGPVSRSESASGGTRANAVNQEQGTSHGIG